MTKLTAEPVPGPEQEYGRFRDQHPSRSDDRLLDDLAPSPTMKLDVGTILGIGSISLKNLPPQNKPWSTRLFKILVSESAYLIWKLRCERRIKLQDENNDPHPHQEIRHRWLATINKRLTLDRLSTDSHLTLFPTDKRSTLHPVSPKDARWMSVCSLFVPHFRKRIDAPINAPIWGPSPSWAPIEIQIRVLGLLSQRV